MILSQYGVCENAAAIVTTSTTSASAVIVDPKSPTASSFLIAVSCTLQNQKRVVAALQLWCLWRRNSPRTLCTAILARAHRCAPHHFNQGCSAQQSLAQHIDIHTVTPRAMNSCTVVLSGIHQSATYHSMAKNVVHNNPWWNVAIRTLMHNNPWWSTSNCTLSLRWPSVHKRHVQMYVRNHLIA